MAAITSPINVGMPNQSRRSYISTGTFHTDIFRYTTSVNASLQTVGTLTSLSSVGTGTAANCPINRVVRENGRRLFPDANPGVSGLLVGVYDAISGLSGFIDPNSSKFALFSSDRANYLADPVNPVSGYKDALVRSATALSLGPPTAGNTYTVSMDANLAQTFTLAPVAAQTNIVGIPAASTTTPIPPVGSLTYLIITFPAGSATSLVKFATSGSGLVGIRESADVNFSTALAGDIVVVTFISDGSKLVEVSRSGLDTLGASLGTVAATQAIVQPATGGGNA
jgi:hypothetical protein